jgi:hypothetical protein
LPLYRIRREEMRSKSLATITAACLLVALSGCRKDKTTDEDTTTDMEEEDSQVDTAIDTVQDTAEDSTVTDTAEDTFEDTFVEDTVEDTIVDIVDEDVAADAGDDTTADAIDEDVAAEVVDVEDEDVAVEVTDVVDEEVTGTIALFFSEYVEGSSNNKAVEIYNAGSAAYDLGLCAVRIYHNGGTTIGRTVTLTSVSLAPDGVYVLCHTSASFSSSCDQTYGSLDFNGNDAVELFCDGAAFDVIGQIGFDPGSEWGTGLVSTADNTLRRKCTIVTGDTNGSDAFDPSIEWDGFATDTFGGLGDHCP